MIRKWGPRESYWLAEVTYLICVRLPSSPLTMHPALSITKGLLFLTLSLLFSCHYLSTKSIVNSHLFSLSPLNQKFYYDLGNCSLHLEKQAKATTVIIFIHRNNSVNSIPGTKGNSAMNLKRNLNIMKSVSWENMVMKYLKYSVNASSCFPQSWFLRETQ